MAIDHATQNRLLDIGQWHQYHHRLIGGTQESDNNKRDSTLDTPPRKKATTKKLGPTNGCSTSARDCHSLGHDKLLLKTSTPFGPVTLWHET